jgi:hypothetical protein
LTVVRRTDSSTLGKSLSCKDTAPEDRVKIKTAELLMDRTFWMSERGNTCKRKARGYWPVKHEFQTANSKIATHTLSSHDEAVTADNNIMADLERARIR